MSNSRIAFTLVACGILCGQRALVSAAPPGSVDFLTGAWVQGISVAAAHQTKESKGDSPATSYEQVDPTRAMPESATFSTGGTSSAPKQSSLTEVSPDATRHAMGGTVTFYTNAAEFEVALEGCGRLGKRTEQVRDRTHSLFGRLQDRLGSLGG